MWAKCVLCRKKVNTVHERFYGTGGHLNPSTTSSALLKHLNESGDPECKFIFDDIKILDPCSHDLKVRFMESIILKFEKQSLNTQERPIPLHII